jgi:hypothetical protein
MSNTALQLHTRDVRSSRLSQVIATAGNAGAPDVLAEMHGLCSPRRSGLPIHLTCCLMHPRPRRGSRPNVSGEQEIAVDMRATIFSLAARDGGVKEYVHARAPTRSRCLCFVSRPPLVTLTLPFCTTFTGFITLGTSS